MEAAREIINATYLTMLSVFLEIPLINETPFSVSLRSKDSFFEFLDNRQSQKWRKQVD
jgi:hypothetical protein